MYCTDIIGDIIPRAMKFPEGNTRYMWVEVFASESAPPWISLLDVTEALSSDSEDDNDGWGGHPLAVGPAPGDAAL